MVKKETERRNKDENAEAFVRNIPSFSSKKQAFQKQSAFREPFVSHDLDCKETKMGEKERRGEIHWNTFEHR